MSRSAPVSRNGTSLRVKHPSVAATTAHRRRTQTPTTSLPARRGLATSLMDQEVSVAMARPATAHLEASP